VRWLADPVRSRFTRVPGDGPPLFMGLHARYQPAAAGRGGVTGQRGAVDTVIAPPRWSSSPSIATGSSPSRRVRVWRRSELRPNEHRGQSYFTLYGICG